MSLRSEKSENVVSSMTMKMQRYVKPCLFEYANKRPTLSLVGLIFAFSQKLFLKNMKFLFLIVNFLMTVTETGNARSRTRARSRINLSKRYHIVCNIALCSKCSKILNEIPRYSAPNRVVPMLNFCDITLRNSSSG